MDYKEKAEQMLREDGFDKYTLPDISNAVFPEGDAKEKLSAFLQLVSNPYLFRVGDVGVHVAFSGDAGDSLQARICKLLFDGI